MSNNKIHHLQMMLMKISYHNLHSGQDLESTNLVPT